jgi:hypothetical protein
MGHVIELTEEEVTILSGIEMEPINLDHEKLARQGPLVLCLLQSLKERNAIPRSRILYWSDPKYEVGTQNTSHKGRFERNGRHGDEIYAHPHFLNYLRYFIFGAQLPANVIAEFEELVGIPSWVSSSDITKVTAGTRNIFRKHNLQGTEEEFYRLALDLGLDQHVARNVRDSVKQVKR